jgi:S-adenosylmethionine uptake transporter
LKEKLMTQTWLNQKGYFQGVFWIVLVGVMSNLNDVFQKYLGSDIPSMEIAWFRFLFSTMTLLPFMLYQGRNAFKTSKPFIHIIRGVILFAAVASWCYGLSGVQLTLATLMCFTVPLFVIIMAPVFLKEKVGLQRGIATLLGFGGIIISLNPGTLSSLSPMALMLLVSAFLFACLDIINKKIVVQESMLAMLFYSALVTSIIGAYPAFMVWKTPSTQQIIMLFCLGGGANLILFCLLKAFAATDVSALAPYRYTEMIFSVFFGFTLFHEIPSMNTLWGAAIIIPTTFYLAYSESKLAKKNQEALKDSLS